MLPVVVPDSSGAEVLATDVRGRPALVLRRVGAGALVLATYPIEHFAASLPNANPEATWRLYRALGKLAGIEPPVRSDRPDVLVDSLVHEDGDRFVWVVSGAAEAVSATVHVAGGGGLEDVESGERVDAAVELPAYGVRVLRLVAGSNHGGSG
jgi:hypothetical protein